LNIDQPHSDGAEKGIFYVEKFKSTRDLPLAADGVMKDVRAGSAKPLSTIPYFASLHSHSHVSRHQ
jgi:hypothetical protein